MCAQEQSILSGKLLASPDSPGNTSERELNETRANVQKKLLILKTGSTIAPLLARGEDFEHWFIAGTGVPATQFDVCHLHEGGEPPPLEDVAGIIITGSAAYVTDAASWNFTGADYLREAHQCKVPVLGVCYGHQLLAWAFGGSVAFHPRGREIGTVAIETTPAARQDLLFGALPHVFRAQVSHQQAVIELPPGAVRLATNDFDRNHAYRLGDTTWSVQFHPEFSAAIVRAYIEHRADAITAEGIDVQKLLAQLGESREAASLLQRFAHYCLDKKLRAAS